MAVAHSTVSGIKKVSISPWSFKYHIFFSERKVSIISSRGAGWIFAGDNGFNTVSCVLDAGAVMSLVSVVSEKSNNSFRLAGIKIPPASKGFAMYIDQRWMQLLGNLQHAHSSNKICSLQSLKSQALVLGHRTLCFGCSHSFSLQLAFVFQLALGLCAVKFFLSQACVVHFWEHLCPLPSWKCRATTPFSWLLLRSPTLHGLLSQ